MYNIHSHYKNIFDFVNNKIDRSNVLYLFPFGSSNIQNIETLGGENPNAIFLCYDQEPLLLNYNKDFFQNINKSLLYKTSDPNKHVFSEMLKQEIFVANLIPSEINPLSIVLLNTEKDSKEKNQIIEKFNFIDCYYFFHGLAATDWYREYYYSNKTIAPSQRNIKKKFITFNRITGNSRVYRSFFIAELIKKQLLDSGYISYSVNCPCHGSLNASLINSKRYNVSSELILETIDLISTLPGNLTIDSDQNTAIPNGSYYIGAIEQCMESFVHVVTETCFWEQKKHLTEKIFKPIVLKQPFILLGCSDNLKYLKEYGFKTFDKWWSEDYDDIEDPILRLRTVCTLLEKICKMSNAEIKNILRDMEEVLEYNFQWFYSRDFVNMIIDELNTNLENIVSQPDFAKNQETWFQSYPTEVENNLLLSKPRIQF